MAGQEARAAIDAERRRAIRRNHTGTHILHWALRKVLGEHVKQAGSLVAPDRLRFDFSHYAAVTPDEIEQIEALANEEVLANERVRVYETTKAEAEAMGAIAFFGDKYGDVVRVVTVHPASTELCGGTHVRRSGDIGLFKVVAESSIASGVRRIQAVTGVGALQYVRDTERELKRAAFVFKAPTRELTSRIEASQKRIKELEKKLEEVAVKAQAASSKALTHRHAASASATLLNDSSLPCSCRAVASAPTGAPGSRYIAAR